MIEGKRFILEKNFERFDFYIEKADNKASFILAFSGILLAGILFQNDALINKSTTQGLKIAIIELIVASLVALIVSDVFALLAVIPRISKMSVKSIMYFESILSMDKTDYENSINNLNDDKIIQELINESLELANICSKKMKLIRKSLIALAISIIPIIVIIIMKLIYS